MCSGEKSERRMAVPIRMPDLGTTVDEVKIIKWLVNEGNEVKRGDLLVEGGNDKASSELESVAEGVLLKQLAGAGESIRSGEIIAYVGKPGESVPEKEPQVIAA